MTDKRQMHHPDFEMVVGLEVHAELRTSTKIFCSCRNEYGAPPNTNVCPICLGMPGTMPRLNRRAVELGIAAGLSCGCRVARRSHFDRKNYFYPDLPKGYQITQYDEPLCRDGFLEIEADGVRRKIRIVRMHLEEDAGKLIHTEGGTLLDLNRCGVPLIEIVSAPDIRSAAEAKAYLTALRERLLFAGVSDCKMNEGSMRCDVNLSVRRRGSPEMGVRTEIKNVNSIVFAGRAIEYEFARQTEILQAGGTVSAQTRRYDERKDCTVLMRDKETAADYRYFPEPDLLPIDVGEADMEAIRRKLPPSAESLRERYRSRYGIPEADALCLTQTPERAAYFDEALCSTDYPRLAANLYIGELLPRAGDGEVQLPPRSLGSIADLMGERRVSAASARKLLVLCADGQDPEETARREHMMLITDPHALAELVRRAAQENDEAARQYAQGNDKAGQVLIGHVMRQSRGCADGAVLARVLNEVLR